MFVLLCVRVVILDSFLLFFFFKQKTAYEMRISDWSSDVCSSDLNWFAAPAEPAEVGAAEAFEQQVESGPRKPQCPERDENDQRVIEALPVQIVHIVEHPEEVPRPPRIAAHEIGRASCRERVCQYV